MLRFEAKAASALNHPNIVTIYDIGQAAGTWFIAAELVEGVTLRERLAAGTLSIQETLDLAIPCAVALDAAHRAGIVHRDIKPENVMVRPDGVVKIVDFGLAAISHADQEPTVDATEPGTVKGTPRYMPPEQARGHKADARSDIFSFGAVLYELVTGRPAFPGTTTAEVFAALLDSTPAPAGSPLDAILAKALEKDRAARYQTIEELARDLRNVGTTLALPPQSRRSAAARFGWPVLAISTVLVGGVGLFFSVGQSSPLTAEDTVLLADFTNHTGEGVFDGTLQQGLAVQLEQSPSLNILPDAQVRRTLQLMGRSPDDPVSRPIAREIGQRLGVKALVAGSIVPLGSHYALALEAIDTATGDTLAREQVEAPGKEQVLRALSQKASQLRRDLGESLPSIRKFDALLERTTSSLEALQTYSLGRQQSQRGKFLESIPFYRRAIELDPNFAYAHAALGVLYRNTRQLGMAQESLTKAYALRDRTTEPEALYIASLYHEHVTGDVGKAIEALQLYVQLYANRATPRSNLGVVYASIGEFEQAAEQGRIALQLDPSTAARFGALGNSLIGLNRFDEADANYRRAIEQQLENLTIHRGLYRLAFMRQDQAAMERELSWMRRQPNAYEAFERQAAAACYAGQWRRCLEHTRDAIDGAMATDAHGAGAASAADVALRGAVFGKCTEARAEVSRALSIERTPASVPRAALALALCRQTTEAQVHMEDMRSRYPKHTIINSIWLPVIRAAVAINQGDDASAIEALKPAARYEAAAEFWPQYFRGHAYLRLGRGSESAEAFTKILDHRGQAVDSVLYPQARLGLARTAALRGDWTQTRTSYYEFLSMWKDADADLPPLVAANTALATLRSTP